jgi:hypothetical protein
MFKHCIINKSCLKDVRLSGTGRGGVRERQENENRKQDKEERHKESNDGCRGIREMDRWNPIRGDTWDRYCTVKRKKSCAKKIRGQ